MEFRFQLEENAPLPIYAQLETQLRRMIEEKELRNGVLDLPREMRTIFRAAPEANWNIELQLGPSVVYARKLQAQVQSEA